jgi:hypothetical protein
MTQAEIHAAALSGPDAQPLTDERLARVKRVPRAKTLRRALGLTRKNLQRATVFRSVRCGIGSKDVRSPISPHARTSP